MAEKRCVECIAPTGLKTMGGTVRVSWAYAHGYDLSPPKGGALLKVQNIQKETAKLRDGMDILRPADFQYVIDIC